MTFENFAPNAAKILFLLGWILAILSFMVSFGAALLFGRLDAILASIIPSILAGLNMLLVPWIAAAIMWRIDLYLEDRP